MGSLWLLLYTCLMLVLKSTMAANVLKGMFVFGDSLVDVGNNNYLTIPLAKGNFPHNGVDFPGHKASGRFSNGQNVADALGNISEKLNMPSPPPYLSIRGSGSEEFLGGGVSFASAGAGILNETNRKLSIPVTSISFLLPAAISMDQQIDYYEEMYNVLSRNMGKEGAQKYMSNFVFTIVIGNADIGGFFSPMVPTPSTEIKATPRQFIDSMLDVYETQLKRIYDTGARKFIVTSVGPIGCVPLFRRKSKTEACSEETNYWISNYNQGLQTMLHGLQTQLDGFKYSYLDIFNVLLNIILEPSTYGFKEEKKGCCDLGPVSVIAGCFPTSSLCRNRSNHVFWDLYHPTEVVIRLMVDTIFDGPKEYAFPVNIRQLVST